MNVKATIPVCLNSILCQSSSPSLFNRNTYKSQDNAHLNAAKFYDSTPGSDPSAAQIHRTVAASLRSAILDLFWDAEKLAFYDFNLTSGTRNAFFSVATFYPLWNGIVPDELMQDQNAFGAFASLNMVLRRYNGTFPSSFIATGLQWYVVHLRWPMHLNVGRIGMRRTRGRHINTSCSLLCVLSLQM